MILITLKQSQFLDGRPYQTLMVIYIYPTTNGETVELSTTFTLPTTLFVPSLSTQLLSVGQVTEDLN